MKNRLHVDDMSNLQPVDSQSYGKAYSPIFKTLYPYVHKSVLLFV